MSTQPDETREGMSVAFKVSDKKGRERAIWLLGQDVISRNCDHFEMHLTDGLIWWNEVPANG
jgi:hypothetical protein